MAASAQERIQGIREQLDVAVSQLNDAAVIEDTQAICGALQDVLALGFDTKDWDLVDKVTHMLGAVATATQPSDLEEAHALLVSDLEMLEELYTRKPSKSATS